mmetsp:Transcript_72819/g.210870  ORF Transcript_72819/g.210870 Transcript_72819/m.210870 type:complete len:214 (+) Transcript_72819:835-1476(+)
MEKTPATRCQKRPDQVWVTIHTGTTSSSLFQTDASARPPPSISDPALFRESGMTAILTTSFVVESSGSKWGITCGPPGYSSRRWSSNSCQKESSLSSTTPRLANSSTTRCHSAPCAAAAVGTLCSNTRTTTGCGIGLGMGHPGHVFLGSHKHLDNMFARRARRSEAVPLCEFASARCGCHRRPESTATHTPLINQLSLYKSINTTISLSMYSR